MGVARKKEQQKHILLDGGLHNNQHNDPQLKILSHQIKILSLQLKILRGFNLKD